MGVIVLSRASQVLQVARSEKILIAPPTSISTQIIAAGLKGDPGPQGIPGPPGPATAVGVEYFNGRQNNVTLLAEDITGALGYTPVNPAVLVIPDSPEDIGAATAAQGVLADTAVQPGALDTALANKVDKAAGYGLSEENYTNTEKTKLGGIATNATANSTDAELRDRSTHTGTQAASTIIDLTEVTQDMVGAMIVAGTNVSVSYDDGAGTLTISATGGGSGMTNPMTTAGDIITGGTSGAAQRLAAGVNGQRLTMVGGAPAWAYDLGATITESTTSRTAALTGIGNYIRFTNASASTFTIPPQSSVAWPADAEIHVRRAAAGNLTLTPGSGVTLNAPSGGTLVMTNNMTVTLKRVASDVWDVIGQTVAA